MCIYYWLNYYWLDAPYKIEDIFKYFYYYYIYDHMKISLKQSYTVFHL